ncbi:class I SAM-dependent DNA methyltransferase [Desnuesiella massiliensis]|uniref:class I SAM-dependent DNA methyltransferase n=1 Tax=Desnuesiella massiliensis TaxID=1650662 RepID=UPI0006E1D7DB|nr:class I SAM-dependent methyltransferase [Desnuesiella massiliensis]
MGSYNKFAEIYDRLIYEDINYEKYEKKILDICKKYNVEMQNYLDLACGTGNMSIRIAPYFKNIWIVDNSEDMLMQADNKFRKSKLKCKLVHQDMASLNLNQKFNLITCILDSTNYIVDIEALKEYFLNVKKHLSDDGIFIFDINSYYKLSEVMSNNTYTYDDSEVFYCWENFFEDDILEMSLTFFVKNDDLYERFDEQHIERAYTEEFIDSILSECGLTIVEKFDDYNSNIIEETTERLVYVLK